MKNNDYKLITESSVRAFLEVFISKDHTNLTLELYNKTLDATLKHFFNENFVTSTYVKDTSKSPFDLPINLYWFYESIYEKVRDYAESLPLKDIKINGRKRKSYTTVSIVSNHVLYELIKCDDVKQVELEDCGNEDLKDLVDVITTKYFSRQSDKEFAIMRQVASKKKLDKYFNKLLKHEVKTFIDNLN